MRPYQELEIDVGKLLENIVTFSFEEYFFAPADIRTKTGRNSAYQIVNFSWKFYDTVCSTTRMLCISLIQMYLKLVLCNIEFFKIPKIMNTPNQEVILLKIINL